MHLAALERLAAGQPQRRVGERRDRLRVAGRRQLCEGAREEVVAGRLGRGGPELLPRGGAAAAELGAVDQVVVEQRRHVDELDGDAGGDVRLLPGRGREEDEQRPQPLAAGRERALARRRDDAGIGGDRLAQARLELLEVRVEPGRLADLGERVHAAAPVWSATIEPASSR